MYLLVGLGNPGSRYSTTRHNIGFMAMSNLAQKHAIALSVNSKFNAVIGKGTICNKDAMIVEPLTFMNLSGDAILKIINWYKLDAPKMLVVFDDISLELGRLRFRQNGSPGGHNGMKSIIQSLGGNHNFPRLKIGIGPAPKNIDLAAFVLQPFNNDELPTVNKSIATAISGIETFLMEGPSSAMNKFNGTNVNKNISNFKKKPFSSLFISPVWSNIETEGFLYNRINQSDYKSTIYPTNNV